jgi:hypothetical protein
MAHLNSIHAGGIDPVELGEVLKEAIENGRIIAAPFGTPENVANMIRSSNEVIEEYTLTAQERKAKVEERMAKMADRPGPGMWAVPEGAERFGMARRDLDYVDPNKKPK